MENTKPVVSVLCMAYNHKNYIRRCLDGILGQITDFSFEVLIHDDASTDGTADIIREYEQRYPDIIKPIYQTENQHSKGVRISKQFLFARAQGQFIAWCECDDYWSSPHKLQKQVSYMLEHEDCSMTFHAVETMYGDKILSNDRRFLQETDVPAESVIENGGTFCATLSLCVRAKEAKQYPLFRDIAKISDYPLQVMMASVGKVHYFPEIMGVYRVMVPGSWSAEQRKDTEKMISSNKNNVEWLIEFNKETNGRFKNSVLYSVLMNCIEIYILTGKGKSFICKYMKKLKGTKKKASLIYKSIKIKLDLEHPDIYKRLIGIKGSIKKILGAKIG